VERKVLRHVLRCHLNALRVTAPSSGPIPQSELLLCGSSAECALPLFFFPHRVPLCAPRWMFFSHNEARVPALERCSFFFQLPDYCWPFWQYQLKLDLMEVDGFFPANRVPFSPR